MKTTYVGGKIIESTGGDHKIYAEEDIISNSETRVEETGEDGVQFGSPDPQPPLNMAKLYAKVRLQTTKDYNGEFGFDWIDINPEDKNDVKKIQDIDFSNVEYFYKKPSDQKAQGTIELASSDISGAKSAILNHYKTNNCCKWVDLAYILIKEAQKITVSIIPVLCDGSAFGDDDEISIEGDEFYKFELEGTTSKKKISSVDPIDLTITCLKESSERTYYIKHNNILVGGVVMMENKTLNLKFRVIALVSSDGKQTDKAKAVFQKFKDANVTDYLNKNSLNQAGYEVEIENQKMFDNLDNTKLDDYFYAFDETDWTAKGWFSKDFEKENKTTLTRTDMSGKTTTTEMNMQTTGDVLVSGKEKGLDFITIAAYKKLTGYQGGLIILTPYECKTNDEGAYSRTMPLDHYTVFVYSSNEEDCSTYAHEIGHMLGLPHIFYTEKEKTTYNNARERIFGDTSIKEAISRTKLSKGKYYGYKYLISIKDDTLIKLEKSNNELKRDIDEETKKLRKQRAFFVNYKDGDKIHFSNAPTMTKKKYLAIFQTNIDRYGDHIKDNNLAIMELKRRKGNNYEECELQMWFLTADLVNLLGEYFDYAQRVMDQMNSNYIMFKQGSTRNFMDYDVRELRYLHNQIKIMRKDAQNYINFPANSANIST